MEVKQIYEIVNNATKEIVGEESLLREDLSNIVDVGTAVFNASAVDAYVKSLLNHIGKVVFVNRPYRGKVPSVLMDGWEYGSVVEKVRVEMPEATENESWELEDGVSYDPNVFYKPTVSVKFFNKKTTFEVPCSITELQVKQSFSNATQLNAFLSSIYNEVEKSMTVKIEALIMRTINNFTAETFYDLSSAGDYTGAGNNRAINLLYRYNTKYSKTLAAEDAITDPDFLRFAIFTMGVFAERMSGLSTLFNIGETRKFTPPDLLHKVLLNDFAKGAGVYLYDANGQFRTDNLGLGSFESVPYWQGSGTGFDFEDISQIKVKTATGHDVTATGILGVFFDRDALAVTNLDRRVTSNYNPKAEFYSNWHKFDAGYLNDMDENFVVFYVADEDDNT